MKVKTRSSLLIALIACWCFTSCNSQAQSPSTKSRAVQPVPAKMVKGKPEGLFYMQKMWIATRYLEKSCWYFAPDGKFYENLTSGFSAEELAAHKGSKGTYRVSQGNLEVTWSDGKSTKGPIEIVPGGFNWETGSYLPVEPFAAGKSIAGSYEGGTSFGGDGRSVIVSKSLHLDADGKYSMSGIATVSASSDGTEARVGGANPEEEGRWQLDGFTLHLTNSSGKSTHHIAFPFDDEKSPVYPDRIFVGGTMYKHQ